MNIYYNCTVQRVCA